LKALKILLTNQSLAVRAGREPFMRDLARELQGRGHLVFAFSSDPARQERLLERDIIAVATDLEHLPFRPDIIHAQHPLDALTALTALPNVPAIYHDHGLPWQLPLHPRLYHYLTAAATQRDHYLAQGTIASERIHFWPTPVDGRRFQQQRELPASPQRILVQNCHFDAGGITMKRVREAATRLGLDLEVAGHEFGHGNQEAETLLPQYDVVFASGQLAAEALACGCAVVINGAAGTGRMVNASNLDHFLNNYFTLTSDHVCTSFWEWEHALQSYQPSEAPTLAESIRTTLALEPAVDRLLDIYTQVITEHQAANVEPANELIALSNYLRQTSPEIMRANFRGRGLMVPEVTYQPIANNAGINPQK
jgi:hypothetical protein